MTIMSQDAKENKHLNNYQEVFYRSFISEFKPLFITASIGSNNPYHGNSFCLRRLNSVRLLGHLCAPSGVPQAGFHAAELGYSDGSPPTVAWLVLALEFPEILALGVLRVFSPPSPGGESGCSEPQATGWGVGVKSSRTPAALGSVHVVAWFQALLHPDVLTGRKGLVLLKINPCRVIVKVAISAWR